ncbi:hypothetical protein PENTCL1PPCAC_14902, partial [Pristionchus entomophagus]
QASRFRQQKLPAWKPLPTASAVLPIVFIVGVACIGIGVALFLASNGVQETFFTYSKHCENQGQHCVYNFTAESDYNGDVYFYYYLQHFHQNARQYVTSRNDEQYLGDLQKTKGCAPFDKVGDATIVPCGAIANSMFNDTFSLTWNGVLVPLSTEGLLWDAGKFANPPDNGGDFCSRFDGTVKPPSWDRPVCEIPDGLDNVDLNVWMRAAALPNFRKPWRKLDRTNNSAFANGLPAGEYIVHITNQYPVSQFGGEKGFVVSTTGWAGGKNSFLGIAYLVVGGASIVVGLVIAGVHARVGKSS